MTVECPMSQHYALGQEVYFRPSEKEIKEGKLVSVGDTLTVKMENGDKVTHLTPHLRSLGQRVLMTSISSRDPDLYTRALGSPSRLEYARSESTNSLAGASSESCIHGSVPT
eukprot:1175561-Prorocentrum_minimum.AAC.3